MELQDIPEVLRSAAAGCLARLGSHITTPFHVRQLMKSGVLAGQAVHCTPKDCATLTGPPPVP